MQGENLKPGALNAYRDPTHDPPVYGFIQQKKRRGMRNLQHFHHLQLHNEMSPNKV